MGSLRSARASPTLPQPFGEVAAWIAPARRQVDGFQSGVDARTWIALAVQAGEELKVFNNRQPLIQAGVLGHYRDALANLRPIIRRQRYPSDTRRARCWRNERAKGPHRGRLPRAIGP